MKIATLLTLIAVGLSLSASGKKPLDADLLRLGDMMVGSYSSAAQAETDRDFFDIRLEMVRIWDKRKDAFWLYVEQAVAVNLERPYRQRVYKVYKRADGRFVSEVYELDEPLQYVGVWKQENPLADLSPEQLKTREGCAVILEALPDGSFQGATDERKCLSDHRGATYATSEIVMTADQLISWDRGWNEAGEQVWGAVKAGYIFKKQSKPQ